MPSTKAPDSCQPEPGASQGALIGARDQSGASQEAPIGARDQSGASSSPFGMDALSLPHCSSPPPSSPLAPASPVCPGEGDAAPERLPKEPVSVVPAPEQPQQGRAIALERSTQEPVHVQQP